MCYFGHCDAEWNEIRQMLSHLMNITITMATNREHALAATLVTVAVESSVAVGKNFVPSRGKMFVDFSAYSNKHYYYYYCTQIMSDT